MQSCDGRSRERLERWSVSTLGLEHQLAIHDTP
jgi:hypothetical protein